eukprot:TRINITY_DN95290_c0_g1_i1.p1 TRINITY_DN95290_c0_g1~~TRINITY_DN95290_c0_g1_i1.p1  ORF type:complete len:341 (+),score=111.31 TRINITY_DN95290_c0_g1_i1:90-1112(+)
MKLVFSAALLVGAGPAMGLDIRIPAMKIPGVPSVLNADANGMPTLPAADAMVGEFKQVANGIGSGLSSLEMKLKVAENDSKIRIVKSREVFNRRLREQELKNKDLQKTNAQQAKKCMMIQKSNTELLKKIKQDRMTNKARRDQLEAMQAQMAKVSSIVDKVVAKASSEDDSPDVTSLLQDDQQQADQVSFIQVEADGGPDVNLDPADDAEADKVSEDLLAAPQAEVSLAATEASSATEDAVSALMMNLKEMKKRVLKTEEKLKNMFRTQFKSGIKRYRALRQQQAVLKKTEQSLTDHRAKLLSAEKHLLATKEFLDKSIAQTKAFLGRMQRATGDSAPVF